MLQRKKGVALWRQIQKAIEADIIGGELAPGQKLPTERELSERFGVNRHTVRRALARLEAKDVIRVKQGQGSFVQEDTVRYLLARRVRFSENLLRQRRRPAADLLESAVVPADKAVAKALQLLPQTPVLRMESIGKADGKVIGIFRQFYPYALCKGLDGLYRDTGSITKGLQLLGITDYTRKANTISARMPTSAEAALLEISRSRPVLITETVNVLHDDTPIEYGVNCWSSDRVQFTIDPDRLHEDEAVHRDTVEAP